MKKSHTMIAAIEKSNARKEGRLPEGLPVTKPGEPLSPESSVRLTVALMLSDVSYSLLFDVVAEMESKGKNIRNESRRRFNELFDATRKAKGASLRASKDIAVLSDAMQQTFIEDAEWLRDILMLLYDRSRASEDAHAKIKELLTALPSHRKGQ